MGNKPETVVCPNCGHGWDNKSYQVIIPNRRPRGRRKFPIDLIGAAKIREGRNTLNAIAKAYSVSQGHLSEVLNRKRNTKRLIDILEFEYKMSIETIRSFIEKQKFTKQANIDTYLKMKEEGVNNV